MRTRIHYLATRNGHAACGRVTSHGTIDRQTVTCTRCQALIEDGPQYRPIPSDVYATAERVIPITMADAQKLPNMLGKLCGSALKYHGYYAVTVDGIRTLYHWID